MSLFDTYFTYVKDTEPPTIYHRWVLISCIGAFLGRRFWLPFGRDKIFANHYIMLIGNPGTRKNTAVRHAKNLLTDTGYHFYAADKTRKEKFLQDLAGLEYEPEYGNKHNNGRNNSHLVLENLGLRNGEDDVTNAETKEVFITAPEFNDFMPPGDLEFLSLLGNLWDWDDPNNFYKFRLKNSRPVHIYQPTISLIGGNTHAGLQEAFPPQAIGQGSFSRFLFIYAEPSGKKYTIPPSPPESIRQQLIKHYASMKEKVIGAASLHPQAYRALDMIYRSWHELEDQRFKHYSTRRFTHLLKLSLVYAAARLSTVVELQDVMIASSSLAFAENMMPKALGEFGKSRNSEAANKIMSVLYDTKKPMKLMELWKVVSNDLDKIQDLANLLVNLQNADKVQSIRNEGFLPKQKPLDRKLLYVDFNLLKETKE